MGRPAEAQRPCMCGTGCSFILNPGSEGETTGLGDPRPLGMPVQLGTTAPNTGRGPAALLEPEVNVLITQRPPPRPHSTRPFHTRCLLPWAQAPNRCGAWPHGPRGSRSHSVVL